MDNEAAAKLLRDLTALTKQFGLHQANAAGSVTSLAASLRTFAEEASVEHRLRLLLDETYVIEEEP